MLAMTDDPWLRLRMVVVVVCQKVRATLKLPGVLNLGGNRGMMS